MAACQRAAADLSTGGNFRGESFLGLDLSGIAFGQTDLSDAYLVDVNISESDLYTSSLREHISSVLRDSTRDSLLTSILSV